MDEYNRGYRNEFSEELRDASVSDRTYNVLIGLHLIYGIVLTAVISVLAGRLMAYSYLSHPILFTLAFFLLSFLGTRIAAGQNYALSLLGYTISVVGFGAMVATVLPFYSLSVIASAAGMTLIVLLTMTIVAAFMPNAFLSMGRSIFIALIGLVIAELAAMLFGFYNAGLFGTIGLFLFALYIGFDWARGQQYPKTASFAVFTALQLYMDVINIFIRILSLTGRKR